MTLPRCRLLAGLAAIAITSGFSPVRAADSKATWVYIGTGSQGKGIYKSDLDPVTGALTEPKLVAEAKQATFLALHPSKKFLYAVSEVSDFENKKSGGAAGFAIDPASGALKEINRQSSVGAGPCHLIVDKAGKTLIMANYSGGSCASLPIEADGKLDAAASFFQHAGKVHLEKRQGQPHAHSANVSPDGKFVFVADLGLDQIKVYKLDSATGKMTPNDPPFFSTAPGAGPRHFAWHPDGKRAYVINEIAMTITAMSYDAAKGVLTETQTISTLPEGEKQTPDYKYSTAEVVVHPSGKFLYGSNRTHDSIAIFGIADDGKLTFLGNQKDQIKIPRNFNIDPSGKWMLVANQDGKSITEYEIDAKTGMLSGVKAKIAIPQPMCIKFYQQ